MGTRKTHRQWLLASMGPGMRRAAIALSSLSCALVIACAIMLFSVKTHTFVAAGYTDPPQRGQNATAPQVPDGTEQILEDAVPLAAAPHEEEPDGKAVVPWTFVLGGGLCFAVVFFVVRIRRMNASISDMQRSIRK